MTRILLCTGQHMKLVIPSLGQQLGIQPGDGRPLAITLLKAGLNAVGK